jgi:pyruvate dehydrogenase complex dehydrogenase (E1) component
VVVAALARLAAEGKVERELPGRAIRELGVDPEKVDPVRA